MGSSCFRDDRAADRADKVHGTIGVLIFIAAVVAEFHTTDRAEAAYIGMLCVIFIAVAVDGIAAAGDRINLRAAEDGIILLADGLAKGIAQQISHFARSELCGGLI